VIVRLKGVKIARSKGHVYYYHRKTMLRLPGEPGSPEFTTRIRELEARQQAGVVEGTLGALVKGYRSSSEFAGLAATTRKKYDDVFDDLFKLNDVPLQAITTDFVFELRDKFARERKFAYANRTVAVLKLLFNWGIRRRRIKHNPVVGVERVARPRDMPTKNRPWRPEELAVVILEAPPWLRVPIAVAAFTGLRESDVIKITWSCYDGTAFETRSQKTNAPIWVPVHPVLRGVLEAAPRAGERIVVGVRGRPIGRSTLTTVFFDHVKRLREEGKVGPGLSFHGLRHTLGTALAEAGCDPPTIAAVLGQATTSMAEHYSKTANRRALIEAAFDRLKGRYMENHLENSGDKPLKNMEFGSFMEEKPIADKSMT
jgi:integrase